jgi:hypothetical protein
MIASMAKPRFPKSRVWRRVGDSPKQQAKWLLEFGRIQSVDELNRTKRLALLLEVQAFITLSVLHPDLRAQMMHWPLHRSSAVSAALLREVHAWLCEGLEKFSRGETWILEQPAIRYRFERRRGAVGYGIECDLDVDKFKVGACEALREALRYIRFCAEAKCRWPLIAAHGRTIYCSTRCSQTTRMRRWRQRHPDEARERRHAIYEGEMRAKYPRARKLKVGRR